MTCRAEAQPLLLDGSHPHFRVAADDPVGHLGAVEDDHDEATAPTLDTCYFARAAEVGQGSVGVGHLLSRTSHLDADGRGGPTNIAPPVGQSWGKGRSGAKRQGEASVSGELPMQRLVAPPGVLPRRCCRCRAQDGGSLVPGGAKGNACDRVGLKDGSRRHRPRCCDLRRGETGGYRRRCFATPRAPCSEEERGHEHSGASPYTRPGRSHRGHRTP